MPFLSPLDYYLTQLKSGKITEDAEQLKVIKNLQRIYQLLVTEEKRRHGWFRWFRKRKLVKGLYLWGGVGIGKTFLMDCFYQSLPFAAKTRMHFHSFMQLVHGELKRLQGKTNPLDILAQEFARNNLVFCFDELHVSDIADAMILGRLFKSLFAQGITLIVTSNQKPDDLYPRGLQRQLFLPAIELLKKHTQVVYLPSLHDYRLHYLTEAGVFFKPHDEKKIATLFDQLAQAHEKFTAPLQIHGHLLPIKKMAGDIIWFEFETLCSPPRSHHDYLAIVKEFKILFLTNIPVIRKSDVIVLFIRLIDVLYDAKVKLVFSSDISLDAIYTSELFVKDFMRTKSRLTEMMSTSYFMKE